MRDAGRGAFITVGSIADHVGFPENSAYAATQVRAPRTARDAHGGVPGDAACAHAGLARPHGHRGLGPGGPGSRARDSSAARRHAPPRGRGGGGALRRHPAGARAHRLAPGQSGRRNETTRRGSPKGCRATVDINGRGAALRASSSRCGSSFGAPEPSQHSLRPRHSLRCPTPPAGASTCSPRRAIPAAPSGSAPTATESTGCRPAPPHGSDSGATPRPPSGSPGTSSTRSPSARGARSGTVPSATGGDFPPTAGAPGATGPSRSSGPSGSTWSRTASSPAATRPWWRRPTASGHHRRRRQLDRPRSIPPARRARGPADTALRLLASEYVRRLRPDGRGWLVSTPAGQPAAPPHAGRRLGGADDRPRHRTRRRTRCSSDGCSIAAPSADSGRPPTRCRASAARPPPAEAPRAPAHHLVPPPHRPRRQPLHRSDLPLRLDDGRQLPAAPRRRVQQPRRDARARHRARHRGAMPDAAERGALDGGHPPRTTVTVDGRARTGLLGLLPQQRARREGGPAGAAGAA